MAPFHASFNAVMVLTSVILTLLFAASAGESNVLFSDTVTKINRRGRMQDRWLMLTGQFNYIIVR